MKQKISLWLALVMVLATVLLTSSVTFAAVRIADYIALPDGTENSTSSAYYDPEKLAAIIKQFEAVSVNGVIDKDRVTDDMIKGLIAGTGDKYAQYMTVEEFEEFNASYEGSFVGIGVTVQYDEDAGAIRVLEVIADSPAEKAGFQANDYLVVVDGKEIDYSHTTSSDIVNTVAGMIRGEAGTEVSVTVLRDGERITMTATRAKVTSRSVRYSLCEYNGKKVAYIAITTFDYPSITQFKEAVDAAEQAGADFMIYDLRNNGGGLLSSVSSMLTYILPDDQLIAEAEYLNTKYLYRTGDYVNAEFDAAYPADPEITVSASGCVMCNQAYADHTVTIPMAVLINGSTASASELFTAALRDYELAITVGENTYGKGCMQSTYSFSDGTALKVTNAFYNPPCGINFDKTTEGPVGIAPDVEVIFNNEENKNNIYMMPHEKDRQFVAAFNALTDGEKLPIPPAEYVKV